MIMKNLNLPISMSKWNYTLILSMLFLLFIPDFLLCQTANHERVNLGLYGGASLDFAYDSNHRLFSAVRSPGTLFYTDDACDTWTQAFPVDSMEYHFNQRGWSGGRRVLTNRVGWVGVQTAEEGGTLESSVISYDDGDSGTFKTAFDNYLLKQIEPTATMEGPDAIDLTDYWFYVAMDHFLVRTNDTSTYGPWNIVLDMDTVTLADTSTHIRWLSVANVANADPLLLVVYANDDSYSRLLKFYDNTWSEIAHPTVGSNDYYYEKVFTHPLDVNMDTIIVSTRNPVSGTVKVFRSLNGGSSWTDITPPGGTNWPLQNADYSPYWVSLMPLSNGLRLSFPGGDFSTDLGDTWSAHFMADNATAASPLNPDTIICSKNKGPQISYDGGTTFNNPDNEGHAAVSITKIAQKGRNTYYVATKAGLGYTIAYHNNAVLGVNKWKPPYGDFPISGVGDDGGVSAVDIDPNDSLHVVVGYAGGFFVTTTGHSGFTQVTPADWNSGPHQDYMVTDVQFITSDTIVAVTGTGSNVWPSMAYDYGNIWRSTDGGNSWTKYHPSDAGVGFEQGNTVAVGYGADTVIYIGCGYWDQQFPTVNGQLWKSTDYGDTWSYVNTGPASQMSGSTVDSMPIYDIDVYPGNPDLFFFASGENLDYAFGKSDDGGATYSYINNMIPEGAFSSVLVHPDDLGIVSCAARRDLWRTNVTLNSTTLVFEGLPGEFVPDLEYGSVIMGTNTGLYKLSEEAGTITTVWRGVGNWSDASKWDNGIPYNICNAVVDSGTVTVDMDGEANDVTISAGAAMTISSGKTVTINGDFVLESIDGKDASFIDDGSYTVGGKITVQRFLSQEEWHYLTPPVSGDTAGIFMGIYLKYWNEADTDWVYVTNPGDPLLAGKGYASWSSGSSTGNTTIEYYGTPNTGDYSPTLTLSGDPSDYGWNLVGNAYPSAFDWNDASLTKTNIDNTLYFWDGANYIYYNGSEGTGGATNYVPGQQAFFIHANDVNPALTITQSSRTHNQQPFLKSGASASDNLLRVHVEGNGYKDEMLVMFLDDATNGFDSRYDAYKLMGIAQAPQLYSYAEGDILSMDIQPFDGPIETIPLGFETGVSGTFTLWISGIGSFPEDMGITLEDTKTGELIDLRTDSLYTFNATYYGNPQRFVLTFDGTTVGVDKKETTSDNLLVYVDSKGRINLKQTGGGVLDGELKIYDMLGREQASFVLNGEPWQQFKTTLASGSYIAKVVNSQHYKAKKVFIK